MDPCRDIVHLFSELDLSQDAAQRLIDPDGDYGYSDLVRFAELVTMEDLQGAGLKIAGARELKKTLEPGVFRHGERHCGFTTALWCDRDEIWQSVDCIAIFRKVTRCFQPTQECSTRELSKSGHLGSPQRHTALASMIR